MAGGPYRFQDGRGHTSQQYPILQPQFKQSTRPVPFRDRYRAPRHEPAYDRVEDDRYEEDVPFDSFDEGLLHRPIEDRQRLAEKGQARLSLAPSHPQPSYRPRDTVAYDVDDLHSYHRQPPHPPRDFSQFAYAATQPQESSSDIPFGASSSPAFRAGQRRNEHDYRDTAQPKSYLPTYGEEENHTVSYEPRDWPHSPTQAFIPASKLPAARSGPQGIQVVSISALPDRLRTVFPYPNFNIVQSRCFDAVYKTNDNFVLASPTGSGKTVILELAICRAISTNATNQYKIVYQAPTKALCSERQRDWQKKFQPAGLNCVELTGDSDAADLRNVQTANIIVTTPEKWDSVTRRWKDHEKLMRLIRLFLIDEVHILKEDRGAILEAVVSRMKSIGTDVRFVALSATIPNFDDIATWLGKNPSMPHEPAVNQKFGEEFRPVKLRKHVCGYPFNNPNDFAFEKMLDSHLTDVIKKYSERKPIMIFCNTRKSTVATAKLLAKWWDTMQAKDRLWSAPATPLMVRDRELRECALSGVAFHHAGIESECRVSVEKAFLNNEIGVICCTSTLAVGVNLPCHMVIIKNTVTFGNNMVVQEYSDLEIMQMLGRAGRPQFENSAVAVIMTRQAKAHKYEKMVTGKEVLESTLHLNLIDHLNAEIGLGTIRDVQSARKWFASTFLYVRLKQNPTYYKLEGARGGQSIDEQLDDICFRDITLLRDCNLTMGEEYFRCSEFGHIMARYYIHFHSMRIFMGLPLKASISEILSAIAQAAEFETIRFRQGEKPLYKFINKSPCTRFPIPVDLALPAHKVSLLIQAVLGAIDIPWDGDFSKHRVQYNTEANVSFKALSRLIRCIIDCQIALGDSVSINNALVLERSIAARVWDDSPSQMKQIDGLGVVGIRKLANAGIRSIEELECVEPHRIDFLLGRNPPFGLSIIEKLKSFPKLRVSLSMQPNSVMKTPEGVKVMINTDIGFINQKIPESFGSKLVYVCMLAETSDGRMVHFARISSRQLGKGQQQTLPVLLMTPGLSINCYIMCDGIAGTQRSASVTPKIALSMFPPPKADKPASSRQIDHAPNMSKRRSESGKSTVKASKVTDEFGDDDINDDELVKAAIHDLDFVHIDNYANPIDALTRDNTAKNGTAKKKSHVKPVELSLHDEDPDPKQLDNGRWACNHACKNKLACKHMCCKDGMDKPPKKTGPKRLPTNENRAQSASNAVEVPKSTQTKLQLSSSKRKISAAIEELDLTQDEEKKKTYHANGGRKQYQDMHERSQSVQTHPSSISSIMHKKPKYCYGEGGDYNLSFMNDRLGSGSSDYSEIHFDDLPDDLTRPTRGQTPPVVSSVVHEAEHSVRMISPAADAALDRRSDTFGDDESIFGDAMIGLADSEDLRSDGNRQDVDDDGMKAFENASENDYAFDLPDDEYPIDFDEFPTANNVHAAAVQQVRAGSTIDVPMMPMRRGPSPSFRGTGGGPRSAQHTAKSISKGSILNESNNVHKHTKPSHHRMSSKMTENNKMVDINYDELFTDDAISLEDITAQEKPPTPEAYKGLEPWLFQEFGDIVEIVDD